MDPPLSAMARMPAGGAVIDRILSRGDSAEALLLRSTLKQKAGVNDGAAADVEKAIAHQRPAAGRARPLGRNSVWRRERLTEPAPLSPRNSP
jgi:hypothetical protein